MDLERIQLQRGAHQTADKMCAMEVVAWWAGEPHSDHPQCACPVIGAFVRRLNDAMSDEERQTLKAYIPALALSRVSRAGERQRAYLAADWAVREVAPRALDLRGFPEHAARLRALEPITDRTSARKAKTAAAAAAYAYAYAAASAYAYAAAAAAADQQRIQTYGRRGGAKGRITSPPLSCPAVSAGVPDRLQALSNYWGGVYRLLGAAPAGPEKGDENEGEDR